MSQAKAVELMLHHLEHNTHQMPEALYNLYYCMLLEYPIIKCKKKWFKKHWVIDMEEGCTQGIKFHLTPEKMWWEVYY